MHLINEGRESTDEPLLPLPWSVLERLRALIPCDSMSFFGLDLQTGLCTPDQGLSDQGLSDQTDTSEDDAAFFRFYWSSPCSYPDRTGDLERVNLRSDFGTPRQLRSNPGWCEYGRDLGMPHCMFACVGGPPGKTLRVSMSRGPGRDFDERDRTLLWLLRPHLYTLYRDRHPIGPTQAQLTHRQHELLGLVAAGHTNAQIGRQLGVSEATVRKHLENIFDRLQVTSRTAAVAHAFPDGIPSRRRRRGEPGPELGGG
jgi:DNA-binding CsgD family transcriptional regulator